MFTEAKVMKNGILISEFNSYIKTEESQSNEPEFVYDTNETPSTFVHYLCSNQTCKIRLMLNGNAKLFCRLHF